MNEHKNIFPHLIVVQLLAFYGLIHGANFRFRHYELSFYYHNFYA